MTVGHCAIHLDGWGHYKLLSSSMVESWWRSGGRAPKNLHVMVHKSGSNIAQQCMDGYAFCHVLCSTKSKENPKGTKFSILVFLTRNKKCVCSIVSSWIIFLKV